MDGKIQNTAGYGWAIVGVSFFALALTFAARSSVGVVMPIWEQELGWARTLSSSGSSLVLAMMAISSPLAGNFMDRYGPRPVFAAGLILLGGAIIATSRVETEWQFLALFGFVGGIGFAALSLPLVSTAVALYFSRNRGLATGIAMSGSTGGQLPVLILLGWLITLVGWRGAYLAFGAALLVLVPVILTLVRRRQDPSAGYGATGGIQSIGGKLGSLARDRTFLLLLGAFTLCGFTTAGVIDVHFVPYAVHSGYALVDGTAAYGVHGVFNMAGILLAGWLADKWHRPRLLAGIYFVRALSFILLLQISHDVSLMYFFAAVFGLLNFSVLPLVASLVATNIGIRIMGLTMGLLFGGHSLGGAAGAFLGGYMYDLLGHYDWLWIASGVGALLAALLTILIAERPEVERPPEPATAAV